MESTSVIHVPFRCPDCGDSVKFDSLNDLRHHLQIEHAGLSAKTANQSAQFPPGLFSNRSATPILEMYHADAVRIEDDILTHKRNEMNNKQRRLNHLSPSRIPPPSGVKSSRSGISQLNRSRDPNPTTFRQFGHPSRVEQKHLSKSKGGKDVKLNIHSSNLPINKYLDNGFRDDESLNDVTRPDITVSRNISRQNNKFYNVSTADSKNLRNSNGSRMPVQIPESLSSDLDNHVKETLTNLSQEVVLTRANQQAAVDSLLASQEVYSFLESSAQEKMSKQQEIIATLALKLSEKDEKLADLTNQVNKLKNRTAEEDVKNILRMKSNQESEKILQEELFYKQKELISLTQRVENAKLTVLKHERERKDKIEDVVLKEEKKKNEDVALKGKDITQKPEREMNVNPVDNEESGEDNQQQKESISFPVNQARLVERDMLAKEKELVSLRSKSMQLESDRQTLLMEMQALLEIAANDNEKLRAELANQGKQLSKLNLELERSKQEQSELLGETNTLYYQADLSLSRLKHVLEERDSQLSSVSAQLEQAKQMQERLTKEREEYLKIAVEKEASYQVLVQENAVQLKIMKESLDKSQLEKEKLQEKMKNLKNELTKKEEEDGQMMGRMREMEEQLAEQEAWQISMREQIKNKEERLHSAKKSMDQMNSFMGDTAKKELEARSRLEQFISSLIERSTQTEAELKKLREAYEAKEEAFKRLIKAQQEELSSKNQHFTVNDGGLHSSHSSWQKETQAEIHDLSSYPSPISSRRLNGLSNANTTQQPQNRQLSPPYHRHHYLQDYDNEQYEIQEPTRLRSTINKVKKNETVEAVPLQQLKNRPILVLGKEYPHPTAYRGKKQTGQSIGRDAYSTYIPTEEQENFYHTKSGQERLKRSSLYKEQFYLPVERDEYILRQAESSLGVQMKPGKNLTHMNSSPPSSSTPLQRNGSNNAYRLNNTPLFKNTPEVEKMYENVQKYSNTSKPSNPLSKRNFPCQHHLHYGSYKSQRLPMDEQGIIWDPCDRSGLRARAQKKKVKRKTNLKPSKKDSFGKNAASRDLKESCDSEDDVVPSNQKSNEWMSPSQASYLQNPTPLGDKIAVLLTSIGPGTVASNARREYEGYHTIPRRSNEKDMNSSFVLSESDSQQSSPILDARAVRERVEKLTAMQFYKDDEMYKDLPQAPKDVNQYMNYERSTHIPNNTSASWAEERRRSIDENMEKAYVERETYRRPEIVSRFEDDSEINLSEGKGFHFRSEPEKPMEEYYSDSSNIQDIHEQDRTKNPYINVKSDDSSTMPSPPPATDDVDAAGYRSGLLNPYSADQAEQFESHNAESDFSSSSYATLQPEKTDHHTNDADYTENVQDTQDEMDEEGNLNEDLKPNVREVVAEVHRESENEAFVDENEADLMSPITEVKETFRKSPMISMRESYFSKSSNSEQSFEHIDSVAKANSYDSIVKNQQFVDSLGKSRSYDCVTREQQIEPIVKSRSYDSVLKEQQSEPIAKSSSYDSVMKELIDKHPYIERDSQEKEQDLIPATYEVTEESESSENILDDNMDQVPENVLYENDETIQSEMVSSEEAEIVEAHFQVYEASDNDLQSSDDNDDERVTSRASQKSRSRSSSRADTVDASTDTDLEKLAMPGAKPLDGKRRKKRKSAALSKEKNRKQKVAPRLKDMARNSWTSVDANDSDEAEREERLHKRRVRVALFCALAYADTQTLLSASQVSRDWRKVTQHPALWKHIVLKDSQIGSQFLITLSQWCTQAQTISLKGLTGRSQRLMESEEDYNNSIRGSLEPGLERLLFACQGTLKSLTIEGCENILTDKCLWLVSSNCRMLTHLTYRSRLDPIHPQLLWALGGGCPGITSLFVHPHPDSPSKNAMNNRSLLQIGQFFRDLQEVGLGGMEFDMAGLLPFIQSCQHLTTIHMDSCKPLTDDLATAMCRAGIKNLQTLTITGTAFQAKAITTLFGHCRQLKRIHATVTPQSSGFDLQKRKGRNEYKKLIKGYKDLQKKAGLSTILTLDITEAE